MRGGLCVSAVMLAFWAAASTAAPIGDERAIAGHIDQAAIDDGRTGIEELIEAGRTWFEAKFTRFDGAGRPASTGAIVPTSAEPGGTPIFFRTAGADSNGCSGCHNSPETGGAGEFVANAFVSEGFSDADFDTVDPQFSNERGTTHLFGSGLIELLAREMTVDLRSQRNAARARAQTDGAPVTVSLASKGVPFGELTVHADGFADVSGLDGVDQDLIVRPFSQKGVFVSIRQFTVNAFNAHHGIQASERYGARYTGTDDFDDDGVANEASPGDITAAVVFQATLPPPGQVLPSDDERREAVAAGSELFDQVGCAECHVPALPLEQTVFAEPNPFNPAGNLRQGDVAKPLRIDLAKLSEAAGLKRDAKGRLLVPAFTDLKRHVIADDERPHFANELLSQRFVERDQFLTARLWGLGSSAPYGHRGDLTTIDEAIVNHGGAAAESRIAYEALQDLDRRRIVEFLLSLRIGSETPR
jgi:cytochrome c peroxidase